MTNNKQRNQARDMMPFLFEDGLGYDVFIEVLKQKVAQENAKASQK